MSYPFILDFRLGLDTRVKLERKKAMQKAGVFSYIKAFLSLMMACRSSNLFFQQAEEGSPLLMAELLYFPKQPLKKRSGKAALITKNRI